MKLADNASDEGVCWPSHSRIARECEMSTKTVQRHIAKLAEDKFVTVTARYSASKQASNMYQLTLDKRSTPS